MTLHILGLVCAITALGFAFAAIGRRNNRLYGGQKSPKGTVRPPLITVQQETPPPPSAPRGDAR